MCSVEHAECHLMFCTQIICVMVLVFFTVCKIIHCSVVFNIYYLKTKFHTIYLQLIPIDNGCVDCNIIY